MCDSIVHEKKIIKSIKLEATREKHVMNILVIGNGFDLAHKLPTKYTDFLAWVQGLREIGDWLDWVKKIPTGMKQAAEWVKDSCQPEEWAVKYDTSLIELYLDADSYERASLICGDKDGKIKSWFHEHGFEFPSTGEMYDKIHNALESDMVNKRDIRDSALDSILQAIQIIENKKYTIDDNAKRFWDVQVKKSPEQMESHDLHIGLNYLCKQIFSLMKDNFWLQYFINKSGGRTWIDFEREISKVIRACDELVCKQQLPNNVQQVFGELHIVLSNYKAYIDRLKDDLDRLILLLEIYLCEYIDNLPLIDLPKSIDELKIDRVISFNYTHTFARQCPYLRQPEIDYIHGEASVSSSMNDNNMILGIDDFPSRGGEDADISFIFFKKYYQRIYKDTDCSYMNWIAKIKESGKRTQKRLKEEYPGQIPYHKFKNKERHRVFIFGHSLDVTDKDVLSSLILNDNVYTTIFYRDMKHKSELIANLDKLMEHEEIIRRTGGTTKTIHFEKQK